MSFHTKAMLAALGLIVVAGTFPLIAPVGATPPDDSKDVRVVNTTAEPVPVAVTGSPTVSITGTPTVHLDNNQVQVTNPIAVGGTVAVTPALPRETFEARTTLLIGPGTGNNCVNCDSKILLDVPDGKVAVIQHVSLSSTATEGFVPEVTIRSSGGTHFVGMNYVDTDHVGHRISVGSQTMTLYAPFRTDGFSDREITAEMIAQVYVGSPADRRAEVTVRISGYLVDVA